MNIFELLIRFIIQLFVKLPAPEPEQNWRNVESYFQNMIRKMEGGYQNDPDDSGNWVNGKLIGTKWGITANSYAEAYSVRPEDVRPQTIEGLDFKEAVQIGIALYFKKPGFDRLLWGPATEALLDYGWHSGRALAAKRLQRLLGVADDGVVGPLTVAAYQQWIDSHGWAKCCEKLVSDRLAYQQEIYKARPSQLKYKDGWTSRTRSFLPSTDWWNQGWQYSG